MTLHLLEDIKKVLNNIIENSSLPSELKFNNSNTLILKQNEKSFTLIFVDKIIFNINFLSKKILLEFRPEYAHIYKSKQHQIYSTDDINFFGSDLIQIFSEEMKKLHGETFGCCSHYVECSNTKKCIHDNLLFSLGCQYRINLINNRIFYGKNKNI